MIVKVVVCAINMIVYMFFKKIANLTPWKL